MKQVGRFENGRMYLTPNEIVCLTKKFVLMYKNRQNSLQNHQTSKHQQWSAKKGTHGEQFKFTPGVSDKNKVLAQNALQKKNPMIANMKLEDRLIIEKKEI